MSDFDRMQLRNARLEQRIKELEEENLVLEMKLKRMELKRKLASEDDGA